MIFAVIKLSGARNDVSFGFSPLSLTNQPSGIRLSVYCVPDLSCRSFLSLGGIPTPNSRTLTPLSLAAVKCPSSWMTTRNINIAIPMMIQSMLYVRNKCRVYDYVKSFFLQLKRKMGNTYLPFFGVFIIVIQ